MEKTKIVIIGITGDYSRRMLLVSLDKLLSKNLINNVEIYGTSRNIKTPLEIINNSMIPNKDTSPLKNNLKIIKLDPSINDDFINFKNEINLQDNEQLIIYLSVPFTSAMSICDSLARNNINTKNVKIMIEKPFGNDLTSAHEFLDSIAKNFNEEQVYRVDHYLQKPACHKLINNIKDNTNNLHSMLNNNVTKEIDIVASEKIDIQGRGDFFEQTGTLRDFVQNHLMQLLSLILVGGDVNIDNLVEEKVNQLKHLHAIEGVRAQYDGYKSEVNNSYSKTETFVCLELESSYER
ncbi:hypothetical protein FACS189459_2760 [Bacilli bacterium]|nr:hypothetical protein FACS189459_2760 [Bacilli bacterium]GHU51754.1 hypothetical protein FACS189496_0660 [Bacilli bacterium]